MAHSTGHWLIYGDSGAGKSTSAATFPTPALVFMFDPFAKETPYTRLGPVAESQDEFGTRVREVLDKRTGETLFRLEHYLDPFANQPQAYARFLQRLTRLPVDVAAYQTVILDSVTFMELAARKMFQYVVNPNSKEPRQWFAGSTDTLEEVLMIAFGSLSCNIVILAHIDEDKDEVHGTMLRNPAAPGRLRKRSPAGYSEVYRAYVKRAGDGRDYLWQTRSDQLFNAASQIGAPDPCVQGYDNIWKSVK